MSVDPNLKRHALKILSFQNREETLAILSDSHIGPLSLIQAACELDDDIREMLEPLVKAHLRLSVSLKGAGRRDIKELINPYKIYGFYPTPEEQHQPEKTLEEQKDTNQQGKTRIFRLL